MREYYYEMVYILRPTMSDEEIEKGIEKVNSYVERYNGEVLHIDKWGRRELAYPINDYDRGYYVLEYIKTNDRDFVKNMENFFRINEDVIRFLTFRLKPSEVKELKEKLGAKAETAPAAAEESKGEE
ncbi:30S ribosomal protein S6 [Desulfurobacterium thermolithotrophum DSM 11699]|uniref:Small ribosomal subunit protein bS6 n=1 Tax=Desulfurobacterium thermolithotrophum (strain DSM 11699 / BSA) TaxID=868864 RepID=F0S466_DESTD|nr:30S ribosomal protein S6 [Desulfurobacterium thermolithotrophum]ADY73638.1 30S ribosomal protein S6 [Desulfurobacterium thermolithotrophum DSM 11699]